jgi:hypothetical protein
VLTNIAIVVVAVGAATLFLYAVTRASEAHSRKESNDFTGAVVAVIGTTYAVLLAFMLSNVWGMFQQAQVNVEQEANDLVNIFRLASLMQNPARQQLQVLARDYADRAVRVEFPSMSENTLPQEEGGFVSEMWNVASEVKPKSDEESQALGGLMNTLRLLTEHRRIRILQSTEALPNILWAVLIAGGIITVSASCFFGVPNFRFHLLQVAVLSFLISLVLVAIADIDRPYQGNVKVTPSGFEFALHTFSTGNTGKASLPTH